MRTPTILLAIGVLGIAVLLLHRHFYADAPAIPSSRSTLVNPNPASRSDALSGGPITSVQPASSFAVPSVATPSLGSLPETRDRVMAIKLTAPDKVRVGDHFEVSVLADASAPVARYSLVLTYDPATLKSVSASGGNFMEQGSALAKFTDNAAANLGEIELGSEQDGGMGVEGMGSVAIVTFVATTAGFTHIAIKSLQAFDGNSVAVPVTQPTPRALTISN